MKIINVILSALVGKKLLSVGKNKFKNAHIKDVMVTGYEDRLFGSIINIDLTLECLDKKGNKSIRNFRCEIEDELNLEDE